MTTDWPKRALQMLEESRSHPGWGYRANDIPYVEPSVVCGFALRARFGTGTQEPSRSREIAQWLKRLSQPDGSVGLSAELPRPAWPTAWALWYWRTAAHTSGEPCRKATEWLLRRRGETFPTPRNVGHDTTIPGWPWVEGTHSWVEPSAIAIQALCLSGLGTHQRVRDGVRLLLNRPVPSGGWNTGNRITKGTPLRALPAPTGISLIALATALTATERADRHVREIVQRAINYLLEQLPRTRAPQSLGWGLLGLAAWGVHPEEAEWWLSESAEQMLGRRAEPLPLGVLLLAERPDRSLRAMGVPVRQLDPHLEATGVLATP